jgi:hypothetical protein
MSASMPWSLLIAWILFSGFSNTHQRHAANFQGSSQGFHLALNISVLLSLVVGLGLLIYYFIQVAWYWPIALAALGAIIGGLTFGLLDVKLGRLTVSVLSFLGWPAAAAWALFLIHGLHP